MDCALWADVLVALETVVRDLLVWVVLAHLSRLFGVHIPRVLVRVFPIVITVVVSKVIPRIISRDVLITILVHVFIDFPGNSDVVL